MGTMIEGISLLGSIPNYTQAPGVWVITTYYNPVRYQTRRDNYEIFINAMRRSGIPCITIECAFEDGEFELPESLDVIRVRGTTMWQKERLLNLAASWLPSSARYIAWIDCDILFTNSEWAVDTARLLETDCAIVQLFETCAVLEESNQLEERSATVSSFGVIAPKNLHLLSCTRYDNHGHTGYAWAMRREIFDKVGLYQYAVGGSADHFMAHAIYGNMDDFCIRNVLGTSVGQYNSLRRWSKKFHALVRGDFAAVPGEIVHLWHGELKNRRYLQRMLEINLLGFNPEQDLIAIPGLPLQWHPKMNKPGLKEYFAEYFRSRQEDGNTLTRRTA